MIALRRGCAGCHRAIAARRVSPAGFSISDLSIKHEPNGTGNGHHHRNVTVELEIRGRGSLTELATELHELEGVLDVRAGDATVPGD